MLSSSMPLEYAATQKAMSAAAGWSAYLAQVRKRSCEGRDLAPLQGEKYPPGKALFSLTIAGLESCSDLLREGLGAGKLLTGVPVRPYEKEQASFSFVF